MASSELSDIKVAGSLNVIDPSSQSSSSGKAGPTEKINNCECEQKPSNERARGKFSITLNQLKKISLDENGTFMSDFDPERSKREMRKLNRKIHKENKKLNQMYDETGRLLENSLDVCDCLDKDCPGCHFPCPKCASEKCGAECRSGRRWTYEQVEVEGTNLVYKWSSTTVS